jgi:YVTN family beta-propeller protein
VDFRILGPLEVAGDDGALPAPRGRAQRALLLYLLLHANELVSSERLVEALWPGPPPPTAQKMIQGYVSQLRKTVGERLQTRPPGYVLEVRDGELDSERVRALAAAARDSEPPRARALLDEALALWRGEPLVDVRYDEFAQPEAARLDELHLSLREQRIDAELALGRHLDAVPELERLVAEHPLREHARAQLMTALYRSGRQAEALEVYREGRRLLVDELGLEPGDELREVERMILAHDAALAAPRTLGERVGNRARTIAIVGALLLAGAVAVAVVEATSGGAARVVPRPNSVAALDRETGAVVADVPAGARPTALVAAFGSIWVANGDSGTVTRIDPSSRRQLATIGVGGDPAGLAAGFGSVWVADGNAGTVTRIDARTNAVRDTISFGPSDPLIPKPVFSIAIGAGSVWATRDPGVVRIDPASDRVVASVPTVPATGLAVGAGRLWVTDAAEQIERFDIGTRRRTGTIQVSGRVDAPLLAGDRLWVLVSGYELWNIDPNSASPFGTTPVGDGPSDSIWDGAVWVANGGDNTVVRIDPGSLRITRTIPVRYPAAALALAGGELWVALQR